MDGGYKAMSGTLARNPRASWFDIAAYNRIQVEALGRRKIFDGFLDKGADVSDDYLALSPSALGPQSILTNNKIRLGFIDSDFTKWSTPSTGRAVAWATFMNPEVVAGYTEPSASVPAGVNFLYNNLEKVAGVNTGYEAWYYGEGLKVHNVILSFYSNSGTGEGWVTTVYFDDSELATSPEPAEPSKALNFAGGNYYPTVYNMSSSGGKNYAVMQEYYSGPYVGKMTNMHCFAYPKVLGVDGAELGFPPGVYPNLGYYAYQMLIHLITKYASPLTASTATVEDDGFLIPQAWYPQEQFTAEIMQDIMKYGSGLDWFIYDDLKFQRRKVGTYGSKWKADVVSSGLNEVGLDSQRLWRTITVEWTDINGRTYTAGPLGSGATIESAALEVTDPDHPAVRAGMTRHDTLQANSLIGGATAVEIGKIFLEEVNELDRSGSATLSQFVQDQMGVFWPVDAVKAGDLISFYNANDTGYRKIVNKSYDEDQRSTEIDLDAPPSGLEALLERLQVGLISMGVSG